MSSNYRSNSTENSYQESDMKLKLGSILDRAKPFISNIASKVDQTFDSYKNNNNDNDAGSIYNKSVSGNPGIVPTDAELFLYPSFTLHTENAYSVEVRGWLSCPGTMSARNKIALSIAKQLIKEDHGAPSAKTAATDAVANEFAKRMTGHENISSQSASSQSTSGTPVMEHEFMSTPDLSDTYSIKSATSSTSYYSSASNNPQVISGTPLSDKPEDIMKARMAYFFAKSLQFVRVHIEIYSESSEPEPKVVNFYMETDSNGRFETIIKVPFKPHLVQASVEPDVGSYQSTLTIEPYGVGIISDIDDTIKNTQVISDARTVFNNTFVRDLATAAVPHVPEMYNSLAKVPNTSFHYVSNSPWQIYPTVAEFFQKNNFPSGSVHLKQYTGNIVNAFMQAPSERKRETLYKTFETLSQKRFILIGDSGEQDFEAYADVTRKFPSQVIAIMIRVVTGSLSDFNDIKILKEMRRLLLAHNDKVVRKQEYRKFADELRKTASKTESDSAPEPEPWDTPNYDWNILSHVPKTSEREIKPSIPKRKPPIPPAPRNAKGVPKVAPRGIPTPIAHDFSPESSASPSPPPLPKRRSDSSLKPVVPKKPKELRGNKLDNEPMPHIERTTTLPDVYIESQSKTPSSAGSGNVSLDSTFNLNPLVIRHSATDAGIISSAGQNSIQIVDKKGEMWLQKLLAVLQSIPEQVVVKFWISPAEIESELLELAKKG